MRSRVWRSCSLLATPLLVMILLAARPASAPAQQAPPSELLATPQSGWLWSNPAPQGDDLEAVEFAGEIGFAAGEDGTVLKSVNGGASWLALSSGITEKLALMQVLDPATVFVSGELGLLESTDGGRSFKEIRSERPCYECSSISGFSFLSATSGFIESYDIFTKSDSLLWTENGGASFEARTPVPLYRATPGQIRSCRPLMASRSSAAKTSEGSCAPSTADTPGRSPPMDATSSRPSRLRQRSLHTQSEKTTRSSAAKMAAPHGRRCRSSYPRAQRPLT
jgi:hypothetical protein